MNFKVQYIEKTGNEISLENLKVNSKLDVGLKLLQANLGTLTFASRKARLH